MEQDIIAWTSDGLSPGQPYGRVSTHARCCRIPIDERIEGHTCIDPFPNFVNGSPKGLEFRIGGRRRLSQYDLAIKNDPPHALMFISNRLLVQVAAFIAFLGISQ